MEEEPKQNANPTSEQYTESEWGNFELAREHIIARTDLEQSQNDEMFLREGGGK